MDEVRFVTCNYCNSKLEVVRDASVTHTRVLEKLEKTTNRIADELKILQLQNDLLQMDRDWEEMKKRLMLRGSGGQLHEPSRFSAIFMGGATGFVGLVALIIAIASGFVVGIAMGLGILTLGIWLGRNQYGKAARFYNLQRRYDADRQRMLALIETERRR